MLFILVYAIVFSAGIYYINRLIARGAEGRAPSPPAGMPGQRVSSVMAAAQEMVGSQPRS